MVRAVACRSGGRWQARPSQPRSDGQLARWLDLYLVRDGNPERLTISTDASITSPRNLLEQRRACVTAHGMTLAQVLPLAMANPARILKFTGKGRLGPGADANILVLEAGSLAVREVIARGARMVRDGVPAVQEAFLNNSDRDIHLVGKQRPPAAR